MSSEPFRRFHWRFAQDAADVEAAQRLRYLTFHGVAGLDCDQFDAVYRHVLIENAHSGELVCCFRFRAFEDGSEIKSSYAAQYYDLSSLAQFPGKMVEIGRFCLAAGVNDPDVMRLAWSILTRFVDENGIELLFGCTSFPGNAADNYVDAFSVLKDRHLAPKRWLPKVKAPDVFRFDRCQTEQGDRHRALKAMPPLLRSYLTMGGWVSDHAVVDRELNTLHVFTGLEVRAIPPARVRTLRATASCPAAC